MPARKSALKRLRQAQKNHVRNVATKSALKTLRKDFLKLMTDKKDEVQKHLPLLQSALDKAAKRGIIHFRKAARLKSRLMHHVHVPTVPSQKA